MKTACLLLFLTALPVLPLRAGEVPGEVRQQWEESVKEVKNAEGETVALRINGRTLKPYISGIPGTNHVLSQFDLTLDGKKVPVAEKEWNDLCGFFIQTSDLDVEKQPKELWWQAREFLAALHQPRVSVSAEDGTVLIEWQRPEECDSHSIVYWTVTPDGQVLRHIKRPPHEC